jgi:hypothetical protein
MTLRRAGILRMDSDFPNSQASPLLSHKINSRSSPNPSPQTALMMDEPRTAWLNWKKKWG